MKRISFILIQALLLTGLTFGTSYAEGERTYSLTEIIGIALDKSETIKASEENVFISEKQIDRARSALFPRLSAFGDYSRYFDNENGNGFVMQPDSSASWGLRLDYSFSLSGRELTGYKMAKKGFSKALSDLASVREEFAYMVSEAFYNVLRAKKGVETASASVLRLRKHRDASESRLKAGESTKTALLRAEAELASAEAGLAEAEGALKLSRAVLSSLTGMENDFDVAEPSGDIDAVLGECRMEDSGCLTGIAFRRRADLRSMSITEEIARTEAKYTRGAFWPSLSFEGMYMRKDDTPSTLYSIDKSVYGGIRLTFLFFDAGMRRAELKQSSSRAKQAGLAVAETKKNLRIKIESASIELATNKKLADAFGKQLDFAKDNYAAVSRQFQVGMASSLDVMDSNTLLIAAENSLANAELGLRLSALKLIKETGTLLDSLGIKP